MIDPLLEFRGQTLAITELNVFKAAFLLPNNQQAILRLIKMYNKVRNILKLHCPQISIEST